ncbi:MAG: YdcF family protein [Actinomycetota bacterium]|nr:YdcF family protein [Actinomycetota bacterium]
MRRVARAALRLVALAALLFLVSLVPFVWPPRDGVKRADAVMVLSGDHGERLAKGLSLMEEGVAPTLVLNGTPDLAQVLELCRGGQPFEVVCLRPDPDSTRAEARAAGRLASERRWDEVVVVTTKYHVTRARLLFSRCIDGKVKMVGATPPYGRRMRAHQVFREWLAVGYSISLARGC